MNLPDGQIVEVDIHISETTHRIDMQKRYIINKSAPERNVERSLLLGSLIPWIY